jgi:hypothetical protein
MATQIPMISVPLKQTNEIDWIQPLKGYIRQTYGDDPERYAEECATLNRLRQDMRGAGKDSAAGRDLLYRYYGQLELLDLRFPVDENHIKISFTWYDQHLEEKGHADRPGSTHSHTSPHPNTPSHTRKLASSSTSPPSCRATLRTRIAMKRLGSRLRITRFRPARACLRISMRTSYMPLVRIWAEKRSSA